MNMYTYIHTYIHTYVHTHIRTYIHTYMYELAIKWPYKMNMNKFKKAI